MFKKGLVNGATGRVVKFEWSIFRRGPAQVGDLPMKFTSSLTTTLLDRMKRLADIIGHLEL